MRTSPGWLAVRSASSLGLRRVTLASLLSQFAFCAALPAWALAVAPDFAAPAAREEAVVVSSSSAAATTPTFRWGFSIHAEATP